jgi:hypothetical protein
VDYFTPKLPQAVMDGGFAIVTVDLSFSFLFISAGSLKNQ